MPAVEDFTAVLGEGPTWSPREQALYWLDTMQRKIVRVAAPFVASETRDLPYRPSCLALLPDGQFLIAYKKGLGVFDFPSGRSTPLPVKGVDLDGVSFNDGACDRAGRLWIGTRHSYASEPVAALYCVGAGLEARRVVEGLIVSNGIAFSPNGRVMYHADSRPGRIDAYDYDPGTGSITGRRVFIDYTGTGRRPDGCTVDAEGFLWVAEIDGWRVARYAPCGRLERTLMLPVQKPSSVAFGGHDLATLFITTISYGLTDTELAEQPLAGKLLHMAVGITGIEEPPFQGLPT